MGAEAYVLVNQEQLAKQRAANRNIRSLLGARRGQDVAAVKEPAVALSIQVSAELAGAAAAAAGSVNKRRSEAAGAAEATVRDEREGRPAPLPEYAALPDLPEDEPSRSDRPLRLWQHQQHQQLLWLQQRRMQFHEREHKPRHPGCRSSDGGGDSPVRRPQPATANIEEAEAALGGASASLAGAAGRVRAACSLLFQGCSVEVFGSSFTSLDLPGSDLDLCVFAHTTPPQLSYYACSQCRCCINSGSGSADGGSGRSISETAPGSSARISTPCRREARGSIRCCCFRSSVYTPKKNGLCSSNCRHGGPEGFKELMRTAAAETGDTENAYVREQRIKNIRLNSASAEVAHGGTRGGHLPRKGLGAFALGIEPILQARVPICKFRDAATGVAVDLSFDQPSALLTSLYVRYKLNEFAMLRPLLLLNKLLLRHWRLHEPFKGGVGSYLLFVMYFGCQFNYASNTISVRGDGKLTRKRDIMHKGQNRLRLSAESPLDTSRDIGCNAYKIMEIRGAWRKAYLRLAQRLVSEVRQAASKNCQEASAETAAGDMPLLCSVFGTPPWPKELMSASFVESSNKGGAEPIASQRPGVWITEAVRTETERAVQHLLDSSERLRRALRLRLQPGRFDEIVDDSGEDVVCCTRTGSSNASCNKGHTIFSSDSDSSGELQRWPWARKQQPQQSRRTPGGAISSARQNLTTSPSSSPRITPMRALAVRTTPCAQSATRAAGKSETRSQPPIISVLDTSDSDSSVVELPQHKLREANQQRRKKRKQRQAEERRKRHKAEKMHTPNTHRR
ncbi:pap 25a associated domain-containing protein [Cyclospora cayetanensis]|uniref:Pap 25a associated domain-containing protein n=1 Tax=Cyclospora cayetanensis TaxID=88456 RepID=A0A1D3D726_9EIME|nr:pap 25a associated domain-containing protein [Cyclospora cayetanensis]